MEYATAYEVEFSGIRVTVTVGDTVEVIATTKSFGWQDTYKSLALARAELTMVLRTFADTKKLVRDEFAGTTRTEIEVEIDKFFRKIINQPVREKSRRGKSTRQAIQMLTGHSRGAGDRKDDASSHCEQRLSGTRQKNCA